MNLRVELAVEDVANHGDYGTGSAAEVGS
jgi:hypothetical protein